MALAVALTGLCLCVVVQAAAKAAPHQVRGLVLLNAAGAMNNKGVVSDWRIIAAYPIFLLIDLLLSTRSIARPLFDNFRQKETLQKVLLGVYKNAAAVDDELVEIIHRPSCDANALDVFVSVITGECLLQLCWLVRLLRMVQPL